MFEKRLKIRLSATAATAAGMLLSLSSPALFASEPWTAAELLDPEHSVLQPAGAVPFPVVNLRASKGLSFDLAGSEQQKLQLRLSEPLAIGTALARRQDALGNVETRVGSTLGWLAGDNLGLSLSASQSTAGNNYQALGSIHCQGGILARDSFTASNCFFVDQGEAPSATRISLGAGYTPTDQSKASFSLFKDRLDGSGPGTRLTSSGLMPGQFPSAITSPWLQQFSGQALNGADSEITGVDLEFQLGVSTNRAGDISLGLQLTRILDADIRQGYRIGSGAEEWNLDGSADSARVSFDWQKGAFSGGVESYYRAPVEFMNRGGLESMTTFDVHFTWRTPWNANLSIGASNLLNSGADNDPVSDTGLNDPFESVYGRIPYVRYEQDL